MASIVYKRIKGQLHAYLQSSKRVGKRIITQSRYLGPADEHPRASGFPDEKSDYKEPPSTSVDPDLVTDTMEVPADWEATHSEKGSEKGADAGADQSAESDAGSSSDATGGEGDAGDGDSGAT